ncbi:MAG: class I adenylate-forming enzyme family protein [Bryobacteraceae bacterium]
MAPAIPQVTLDQFENHGRHLIHQAVDHWAALRPDRTAIVNATRGTQLTWRELQRGSLSLAAQLQRMGFRKGDFLAASLPLLNEHIMLEYACFRMGVIHAPLDLRLEPAEVIRCLGLIGAKGYFFLGKTPRADFAVLAEVVRAKCAFVEHFVQFSPPAECIAGATSFFGLLRTNASAPAGPWEVSEHDGAQVIFTTGSTGSTKPALLSHRGITCQNLCLAAAFRFGPEQRVLCNLPASHVGGQSEILLTSLFAGGTAVTLEVFDPVQSLEAIECHGVTLLGQIPAMFQLEWRTADCARRNLSSLELAVYGGQAVPKPFLDRMLEMAPRIATGLGLTEASGFCTYTPLGGADVVADGVGWAMPAYRMSVRESMDAAGAAGGEKSAGEVGHICFQGPQTFLGYVNDAASTARAISTDDWLYTGDLGFVDERGLHFSGREKWVLKPAGHQVFPGDVEGHFGAMSDRVASVGVVGPRQARWSEAIIAVVEPHPGGELSEAARRKHARGLTSYMRPLHYVILEPGAMPLNRTAKVDVARLQALAREEVAKLRARGRWDG